MSEEKINTYLNELHHAYLASIIDAHENHQAGSQEFADHISTVFWDKSLEVKNKFSDNEKITTILEKKHNDIVHSLHEFTQQHKGVEGTAFQVLKHASHILDGHQEDFKNHF